MLLFYHLSIYIMVALWVVITVLFLVNVALMLYFLNKFEKMFIIMKAWSLKDLVLYYKEINKKKQDIEEEQEFMP